MLPLFAMTYDLMTELEQNERTCDIDYSFLKGSAMPITRLRIQ